MKKNLELIKSAPKYMCDTQFVKEKMIPAAPKSALVIFRDHLAPTRYETCRYATEGIFGP